MWKIQSAGASMVEEALRQYLPPCQVQCPINEDIQRTNVLISLLPESLDEARDGIIQIGDYLYEKNPFFAICGYVCGLCELGCNYKYKGGAIKRRLLKRFIGDIHTDYLPEKDEISVKKHRENVAVVGGGPAGLMCAYHLSKRGFRVTIFEGTERLGGALWLIPRYRLPERILSLSVENLVRIGRIDVKYNLRIGDRKWNLDRLLDEGFEAIFLAKGTPAPRRLTFGDQEVPGQDYSGVMYGHTFLYEVSHGNIPPNYFQNKRVIVIGGGNVAFDVARTSRRLGGEVSIVCLENEDKTSPDGIPADPEEIRGAWQEGIRVIYSRGVRRIYGESERFKGIDCPRCTRVYDETGFNPQFDLTDSLYLKGDVLIITVGQGPDKGFLYHEGLLDERGRLVVDPLTLQSLKRPNVFIGGDLRRVGFMAEAMRDGMVAAESIARYLAGEDLKVGRKRDLAAQEPPIKRVYQMEPEVLWIPPEKRMHFQVYERGFSIEEAIEEARRCLYCGPCISCKACVSIGIQESLPYIQVRQDRCSGCGVCVSACFYHATEVRQVDGNMISLVDTIKCKACGMCVEACPSNARGLVGDPTAKRFADVLSSALRN